MYGRKTGGRKAGTPNKATAEIRQVAMLHGPAAVKWLAVLMKGSGAVAVAACRKLLDRGYGKSLQPIDGDGQGGPMIINVLTGVPRYRRLDWGFGTPR